MRKYNFIRPILILVTAFLVNNLAANLSILLGASPEAASNIGFIAMLAVTFILFIRMTKQRHRK
ncbi:hypothetical protein EBB07_23950 [Paenibacillaceae bacterium]|nr:hypothetical protein EBB07_23950 [Paenibacillaceae bacterium]